MSAGRGENASFQSSQRRAAACILKIYPKAGMPACGKRENPHRFAARFRGKKPCFPENPLTLTFGAVGSCAKICALYFKICQTYFELCQTYFLHPPEGHENSAAKSRQKTEERPPAALADTGKTESPRQTAAGIPLIHACLHIDEHTLPVFSYLTRTFSLPTMYMPLASPLVASVGITSLRRSTPSMV